MGFIGIMAGSDYTPRLTSTDLNHPGRLGPIKFGKICLRGSEPAPSLEPFINFVFLCLGMSRTEHALFPSYVVINPFRLDLALIRTHLYHSVQAPFSSNPTRLNNPNLTLGMLMLYICLRLVRRRISIKTPYISLIYPVYNSHGPYIP